MAICHPWIPSMGTGKRFVLPSPVLRRLCLTGLDAISWLSICPDVWILLRPIFKISTLPFARLLVLFAATVLLGGIRMKVAKEAAAALTVRKPFYNIQGISSFIQWHRQT